MNYELFNNLSSIINNYNSINHGNRMHRQIPWTQTSSNNGPIHQLYLTISKSNSNNHPFYSNSSNTILNF